jgi:hypothetical protein
MCNLTGIRAALATLLVALLATSATAATKAEPAPSKPDPAATPTAPAMTVEKAVAAMRHVDASTMTDDQREAKAVELDAAWKTLIAAGKPGADALKAEIAKVDAAKEKDDFFRLGAGSVLWQIGKLDEAKTIAALWRATESPGINYNYVFFTAFEAAQTQDPRAEEMLLATLRHRNNMFIPQHVLRLPWAGVHAFLWGAYGPKVLPVLAKVLETTKDPLEAEAAVQELTMGRYLPALPAIRKLAAEGTGDARAMAVRCLGTFGHPQDYEFLVKGLDSKDPKDAFNFAFALYEFDDLRAVPRLVPLLDASDDALRGEVGSCLEHLLTPQSFDALMQHRKPPAGASAEGKQFADFNGRFVGQTLKSMGLSETEYLAKPAKEQEALLAKIRNEGEEKYVLRADDRRLTHDELLKAAEGWKKTNTISGGEFAWVEDRHALAASTAADIDLWLQVKAKILARLSDECLEEVDIIEGVLQRLSRSRFRTEVGITAKAEMPATKSNEKK